MPKPRQRQRIVYCECFDCLDRQAPSVSNPAELAASDAVARQDPPPKALLLYGSGFLRQSDVINLDASSFPHLDRVAREGNLGLAVQPVQSTAAAHGTSAAIHELAALLGVHEAVQEHGICSSSLPSLHARFKGISSLFASTSQEAAQLAKSLGMVVEDSLQQHMCTQQNQAPGSDHIQHTAQLLPPAQEVANRIIRDLGVDEGHTGHDLMMLHVDVHDLARVPGSPAVPTAAGPIEDEQLLDASLEGLEWMDSLTKCLMQHPGICEQTLMVLVLSSQGHALAPAKAGAASEQQQATAAVAAGMQVQVQDLMQPGGATIDPGASVVTPRSVMAPSSGTAAAFSGMDKAPCPVVQRPVQSFQKQGQVQVAVQLSAPMIVAQRLPGVIRRDRSERLGLQECHTRGGQGCILVERLLPEIAYKLGRAGKYGA